MLGCKFYIFLTHLMEHRVELTWLVDQLQKREMPHLKCPGSRAITREIPTLLGVLFTFPLMLFTFPLSSCYRSIELHRKKWWRLLTDGLHELVTAATHRVLFGWVLYKCMESGHLRLAEPMSHSNLISEISWVLQIKVDLHREQRNLRMVLAHSRASAVSQKYSWSLGQANISTGLIMPSFESVNKGTQTENEK